jgi:AcrR family transcriptional regulator
VTNIVSKDRYYSCAFEMLAESGFKDINVGALCRRLGVTSGSFYHHFGGWDGFVAALLEHWGNRQIVQLREREFGTRGTLTDLNSLLELTVGLPHQAEAALRAWAANSEAVRLGVDRVDEDRRKTIERVIERIVGDAATARHLTSLGACVLVGHQQLLISGRQSELSTLLEVYRALILSHSTIEHSTIEQTA